MLPQRKQCSILKTLPKSQESKESTHGTQTRAGIKIQKVNKWFKGSNAANEFLSLEITYPRVERWLEGQFSPSTQVLLTQLFISEKNGSFSAPRREAQTSYKTSKHPLLQGKLHPDSTEKVHHSPLYSIFLPHKLTANGTAGYSNLPLQGFAEDSPRCGLVTCISLPHSHAAQNPPNKWILLTLAAQRHQQGGCMEEMAS